MTVVVAHRACPRDVPENSIAGVLLARSLGADAVEIDVRLTRDGVPVLLHDRSVLRTTLRTGRVDEMSVDDFRSRRHRGGSATLPTLREALERLPAGLVVALDCKDDRAIPAAAEVVADLGLGSRTMVWARSPDAVAVARSMVPDAEVALLRDTRDDAGTLRYVRDAHAAGASQVSVHQRRISRRVVEEAEALGVFVFVWVVRREAHEAALATGVHGVVTDWPAIARSLVA